ncbi:MAG: HNH endonuclease [Mesorhizobium sp.]|nr:MAG: HNH endonuclease [Mesorhizobium sp.]
MGSVGRSDEATAYRKMYNTARWRRIREYQLSNFPLCQRCLVSEVVEPATVVHHADGGHKGDVVKFYDGPFESLCKPHHDRDGQLEDHGRTVIRFGVDGWPL